jgi:hypothetical protein
MRFTTENQGLEIPAASLFFLDRDKQRFEIALAEALAAFALQDLVEDGRAIFDGFSEDL